MASFRRDTNTHPVSDSFHYSSMLFQTIEDKIRPEANSNLCSNRSDFLHSIVVPSFVDSKAAVGYNSYNLAAYDPVDQRKKEANVTIFNSETQKRNKSISPRGVEA